MFRRLLSLIASVAVILTLVGCGGGSGNAPTTGADEQTLSFGNLTTRIARTAQPAVSLSGTGTTVTGIAGGMVSSLVLSYPTPTLNQTRIAFTRNGHLYTISPDGTGLTQLTAGRSPVWSPDGSKIAFVRIDSVLGSSSLHIYTISADGTGLTQLTTGGLGEDDFFPVWSPDGSKIAFIRGGSGAGSLYTISADGTGLTKLTPSAQGLSLSLCWSPDGSKIAFNLNDTPFSPFGFHTLLYTIAPDGTGLTQLTNGDFFDGSPAWSPDGSKIAFEQEVTNNYPHISHLSTIAPDGTGLTQITQGADSFPVWSPNGSKIAFLHSDPVLIFNPSHLSTIAPDGTGLTQLATGDSSPAWSPDGSKIAFAHGGQISVIAPDGTGLTQLTTGNSSPAWSTYIKQRTFLGTKGILGTSAAGFLFGQQGNDVQSIVAFDTGAGQQTTARVSNLEGLNLNNQVNLLFTISAASLTSLTFAQKPGWNPVTIIGAGGVTTSANGAVVSFDAQSGQVIAVLPYTANKAAGGGKPSAQVESGVSVLRGSFLGVWDGKGKNLAPQGATEVRLDSKTGAILSVK